MKKYSYISILLLYFHLIVGQSVFAQKNIDEITIRYKILAYQLQGRDTVRLPVNGAVYTVYVKDNQTRTDFISRWGSESVIFDRAAGRGVILKNYDNQGLMYTMNQAAWDNHIADFFLLNFQQTTDEKMVGKFSCKRAVSLAANGRRVEVYHAPEISIANNQYELSFRNISGLPVRIINNSTSRVLEYELTEVSFEPIATNLFEIPKSGYRVLDYLQSKKPAAGRE